MIVGVDDGSSQPAIAIAQLLRQPQQKRSVLHRAVLVLPRTVDTPRGGAVPWQHCDGPRGMGRDLDALHMRASHHSDSVIFFAFSLSIMLYPFMCFYVFLTYSWLDVQQAVLLVFVPPFFVCYFCHCSCGVHLCAC